MKRKFQLGSPLVLFPALLLSSHLARATTLYVAPHGNDGWSGTLAHPNKAGSDGPLASLQGARDALRRWKQAGPLTEPVHVVVEQGNYEVKAPLVLEPQDSGTAGAPVSYEAAPGSHPVFNGGRAIQGWKRGANGIWSAQVPAVKAGQWVFEQLWVNGKRATRARTPNKFFFYGVGQVRPGADPTHGDPTTLARRAFRVKPEDVAPLLTKTPEQLRDVTVVSYFSWESSREHVAALDGKTGTLALTGTSVWPFFNWDPQRYQLENYKEALDEAGEWFLDRDGTLYYKPLPGQDMTKAAVVAPLADNFLTFNGDPDHAAWVEYLNFKGLAFRYSQYVLPPEGHADGQAEIGIPAVITADGARDISFQSCNLSHIGTYAMHFREGCQNISVSKCYLTDLGAGGIRIGEDKIRPEGDERTSHITVDNNIIHGLGRIHHGAIGVWIGQSGDNQITHNDIGDTPYTTISAGWTWGYGEGLAKRNVIAFNHLHDIGEGVLSDMGGVYTLGPSEGTTVNNNRIHDVHSYGYSGWGLYNDEGSTGITLENNLVYDTLSGGYHQHYGKENLVRNNIFAFGQKAQLQRSRVEPDHLSFTFENNLIYWDGGPAFNGNWKDHVALQNNLYWDASHGATAFNGQSFAQWQADGQDKGSLLLDPQFKNPELRDFRLAPNSPATQAGFKPFNFSLAGVYGDPAWVKLAATDPMPKLELAPEPTIAPLLVDDDFEDTPLDSGPIDASVHAPSGSSIGVSGEQAQSGNHSLKVTDGPGLTNGFDPHFYYEPHHQSGISTESFDLCIEPGTNMYHEWRDVSVPYRIGPSIAFFDNHVLVNGQVLLGIPDGQWTHFVIQVGLGSSSTGTWDLTITPQSGEPHHFPGLKNRSADWKTLSWLGFASVATDKTSYYLDNIHLVNRQP